MADERTISHLLCDQVEFANVIVVNKCDLMTSSQAAQVKQLVRQMNPTAKVKDMNQSSTFLWTQIKTFACLASSFPKVIESTYSKVPLTSVMGTGLFSMSVAETHNGWLKEARIGEHTPETIEYSISSFTYRARKPFMPHKLQGILDDMLNQEAPFDTSIILRAKGFVWLANFPGLQGDFSLAGKSFSLVPGNPWWAEIQQEDWPDGLMEALGPLWQGKSIALCCSESNV